MPGVGPMTKSELVYGDTLNLLGTVLFDNKDIQDMIDREHAAASPSFKRELAKRVKAKTAE